MKTSTICKAALAVISGFLMQSQTAQAQWSTSGSTVYYNGGSVGIGTSNPMRLLQIANPGLSADVNLGVSGWAPSILFSQEHDNPVTRWSKIGLATSPGDFVVSSQPGDFVISSLTPGRDMLFVNNPNTTVEAMRISDNGYLGLGTTTPTAKLHSNGTVRFENLPYGAGYILVADNDGNVYKSSSQVARTAGQERNEEIDALKEKVEKLEQALQLLQQQLGTTKGSIDVNGLDSRNYQLEVSPNPAGSNTTIRYSYPSGSNTAFVNISDQSGKLIKRINIKSASKSTVNLSVDEIAASTGTYVYSLEVNGKIAASKKVVLVK